MAWLPRPVVHAALVVGLAAFLVPPLVFPLVEAFAEHSLEWTPDDFSRLGRLALHTLSLAGGTVLIVLPLGTILALLLFRTDLPRRRLLIGLVVFAVFIPLPVVVSGWQALVGSDGWWPLVFWGANADRPWSQGLLPAIWVHAAAGLPWVVLIVGTGLNAVERELEEEAVLCTRPWRVVWRVTLPRAKGSIFAAAVLIAVYTVSDVVVSDMLLIPTLAEEIQIQVTESDIAQAVLLSSPVFLGIALILGLSIPRLAETTPPLQFSPGERLRFPLGRSRWLWFWLILFGVLTLLYAPVPPLLWKLGLVGRPLEWSPTEAARQFLAGLRQNSGNILQMLGVAILTGAFTAGLAVVAASWAQRGRRRGLLLLVIAAAAWTLPGPLVGIGLKEIIQRLSAQEPLKTLLYSGPSPAPIIWAHAVRFFPFALAVVWPVVRMTPPELRDLARLEGASPWQEWLHVTFPFTWRGWLVASLAVTALALGEVGAGSRVETPGWETFAKPIFDRMHYGVDREVASLAIVILFWMATLFAAVVIVGWLWRRVAGGSRER